MNIVLLQHRVTDQEIDQLLKEFPNYLFLPFTEFSYKKMGRSDWEKVEVIFGDRLTPEELQQAGQLRWVHTPTPYLNRLCIKDIEKRGNILITTTSEENISQIGEFVTCGILAMAKNLFQWRDANAFPALLWDSKWRDSMWTIENRVLLQIGLGKIGTEIARRAQLMGMQVWGVQQNQTFHPFCNKVFTLSELHSVLPAADVVSITLPRDKDKISWIKMNELNLMKEDSMLIIIGSSSVVDEDALVKVAYSQKLRGIMLDAFYQHPIPTTSKLWGAPNVLITPGVAPRPKSIDRQAYRIFRYNLRQYLYGNFKDMRNVITEPLLSPA